MFLSYQYRIYPLRAQLPTLAHYLGELTHLWNHALEERRNAWEKERRRVSCIDQQDRLKTWRAYDHDGLGRVPYSLARDILQRLDVGFQAFFRNAKSGDRRGYPRFRRETTSFTFVPGSDPWSGGPNGTWRLQVPRLGAIPVRRHRAPPRGTVKAVTISREVAAWYATFQYEVPDPAPPFPQLSRTPVGVDLGLTHLAFLSTGESVEAPQFLRRAERKLRREQRHLSRKESGSCRYGRQRDKVARCHARVRRQRKWLAHQLSHDWSERFDLIAFEDLSIQPMMRNRLVSRSISDAGWGLLRRMCEYKQALRSGTYVEVPAQGTTQTCSNCGRVADPPLTLYERWYDCPCGYEANRDLNAARNILERGLHEVRRNTAELTRVDGMPPPARKGRRAYQRRRENATRPASPEWAQSPISGRG